MAKRDYRFFNRSIYKYGSFFSFFSSRSLRPMVRDRLNIGGNVRGLLVEKEIVDHFNKDNHPVVKMKVVDKKNIILPLILEWLTQKNQKEVTRQLIC